MSIEDAKAADPAAAAVNREPEGTYIPADAYEQLQQLIYTGLMKGFSDDQYQTNQ